MRAWFWKACVTATFLTTLFTTFFVFLVPFFGYVVAPAAPTIFELSVNSGVSCGLRIRLRFPVAVGFFFCELLKVA